MNKIDTFEDLSFQDTNGNSALHWASSNGLFNIIPYLAEKMDNINIQNANGDTPLILAVKSNQIESTSQIVSLFEQIVVTSFSPCPVLNSLCSQSQSQHLFLQSEVEMKPLLVKE